jgi:nitrite reductase (NADH) large subunit
MKHLILGNGAAGMTAAAKLRELRSDDDITVVSYEEESAYAKIMLPDYIGGKISREKLFLRDPRFYINNRISLIGGRRALRVDTHNRLVELDLGQPEHYDNLLVSIGGVPFVPAVEGLEGIDYLAVNSLKDADMIKSTAKPGMTAVICGGGLTGIEMGFALGRQGMKVFLVEREETVLPLQLDRASSDVMVGELQRSGVNVLAGRTVLKVQRLGQPAGELRTCGLAELSDGTEIPFQMLIFAIGTRPSLQMLKDTPVRCERGVLVNERMKTSEEGVYAAGDVAQLEGTGQGGYVSPYIWPNAMAQGKCAAFNMAGQPNSFDFSSAALNAVQLRDMPFFSMGLVKPRSSDYEELIYDDKGTGVYKKLVLKDNILKGMTFLGSTANVSGLSSLIRKGTDVSQFKHRLLDEGFKITV